MWKEAMWAGVPVSELEKWTILEGDLNGRFAYYRCEVELNTEEAKLTIDITANSRYRLWVNESPVLSGPCKGDTYRHYYDTVDISKYLVRGKNVIAVQVLYCDPESVVSQWEERASLFSVLTPRGGHRLAVEGEILDEKGNVIGTVTTGKADWRVYLDGSFFLKSTDITENLGAVCEEIDVNQIPADWKSSKYQAPDWKSVVPLESVLTDEFSNKVGLVRRFMIKERPIPLLYEQEESFESEIATSRIQKSGILETGSIRVLAGEKRAILLDAGVEKNGYPIFRFDGGKGSRVCITYLERFTSSTKKIKKTDAENGEIIGLTDSIILNGKAFCYEPFRYRTFRFLYMEIEAKEDVTVYAPVFRKTGYPLLIDSWVASSEKWVGEVWDICSRTLQNCMVESYMDCPYYEQMQFSMDTRLQAMFNYELSTDTKLARKALEDFHCCLTPEGLIHGKYPSAYCQIISTFSLHYIYMLKEYYMQTGDLMTIKMYLPDVDAILGYYDRKIGPDGLEGRLGYWEFVDWQKAWADTAGAPAALSKGPSTIINLMYGYALKDAAFLYEAAGRREMASEFGERREKITRIIRNLCWNPDKMLYREGPEFEQYSQHAQAWAVLNEMDDQETAQKILKAAMTDEEILICSFSTSYEWFRALEKAGLYSDTEKYMKRWAKLPEQGSTTCPEEPEDGRSECHAWSALPLYEMIRCMAGIKPYTPGWSMVEIRPQPAYLTDLEGEAVTPGGKVYYKYQKQNGKWNCQVRLPEGVRGIFIYPDGKEERISGGKLYQFSEV